MKVFRIYATLADGSECVEVCEAANEQKAIMYGQQVFAGKLSDGEVSFGNSIVVERVS